MESFAGFLPIYHATGLPPKAMNLTGSGLNGEREIKESRI